MRNKGASRTTAKVVVEEERLGLSRTARIKIVLVRPFPHLVAFNCCGRDGGGRTIVQKSDLRARVEMSFTLADEEGLFFSTLYRVAGIALEIAILPSCCARHFDTLAYLVARIFPVRTNFNFDIVGGDGHAVSSALLRGV
jgi:hypothetical protein